jgi:type IV pilus assembly protein PilN
MEFSLNLASRSYLDRRTVRRWLMLVGGLAALLLAVNLYYALLNIRQLGQVDAHLVELDAKLMAQRSETAVAFTPENLARVNAQIEAANQIIDADQFRWTTLLGRLEELLPEDVAIRSLKPNYRDHSLQLTAVAKNTKAMTTLLDRLLASDDLPKVHLNNQALLIEENGPEIVEFSLVIQEAF